jgi:hypothetical protein
MRRTRSKETYYWRLSSTISSAREEFRMLNWPIGYVRRSSICALCKRARRNSSAFGIAPLQRELCSWRHRSSTAKSQALCAIAAANQADEEN